MVLLFQAELTLVTCGRYLDRRRRRCERLLPNGWVSTPSPSRVSSISILQEPHIVTCIHSGNSPGEHFSFEPVLQTFVASSTAAGGGGRYSPDFATKRPPDFILLDMCPYPPVRPQLVCRSLASRNNKYAKTQQQFGRPLIGVQINS
jgi:hypothetical protein